MYITLETDYAIRIMDYLSDENDIRQAKEISEAMSVPIQFARNILKKLLGQNMILSYKGANGGYKIAKLPHEISLYDIFQAMDEPMIMNRCLRKDYDCNCSPDKDCVYYRVFHKVTNVIEEHLREATLADGQIVTGQKYRTL